MRRLLIGLGALGWLLALASITATTTPITAEAANRTPSSGSAPAPPLPPPSSSFAATSCGNGVTTHAMAIPHGKTGVIQLVLTDHAASCAYWSNQPKGCNYTRARIYLKPSVQAAGKYRLSDDFAYLDREFTTSGGAWQSQPVCTMGGGDLNGDIEILAITQTEIKGRICGSHTGDPRDNGLADGVFVAKRCPACAMTGDSCQSNADCCAANCGGGTCHP
jgi:hypothetical protein